MRVPAILFASVVLLVPLANAQALAPPPSNAGAACAGPPCGYITPIVELAFAGKPRCTGAPGSIDLSKCIQLPAKGKSVSFDGTLRYYWKLSEDLTYPPGQEPIVVSFSGVSTNPTWLTFTVEPSSVTITAADLVSPLNMHVDQTNPAAPVIYYDFQAPLRLTFTHGGDPDAAALGKIAAKGGVTDLFVKAKSTASGAYFKEGFGVESFRFATASLLPPPAATHGAPASLLVPLLALALAAVSRRR